MSGKPDVYGVKGKTLTVKTSTAGNPVKKMSGKDNLGAKVVVKKAGK